MSHKINKKALMGAALLATAPTVKAEGTGSYLTKSKLGINHLILEESPLENITFCVPSKSMAYITGDFKYILDKLAVVNNPLETNFVKMTFVVSHITAMSYDRMLFLAYSEKLSHYPQIPTPKSINKLELDINSLEIIAVYDVSSFGMKAQAETRITAGHPTPRVKWEFDIYLDTLEISTMMESGNDTIYVQAALIKKSDYEEGKWNSMILSEVDTIQFVPNKCPETMVMEEGNPPVRIREICADNEGIINDCSQDGTGK